MNFFDDGCMHINLSFLFKFSRIFDGEETVALVTDKAAEIAGLTMPTELEKSNTDTVKWVGAWTFGYVVIMPSVVWVQCRQITSINSQNN